MTDPRPSVNGTRAAADYWTWPRWICILERMARAFHFRGLLLLCFLLSGSCAPQELTLLELTELTPEELAAGSQITLRGAGFPAGRAGRLRLVGSMHRAGQASTAVDLTLPARALTGDLTEATVNRAWINTLGGSGTFTGMAELSFASTADRDTKVLGRLHGVEFDVLSEESLRGVSRAALRKDGRQLLAFLGLTVDESADSGVGLRVDGTIPGSPAERAGIAAGDRIERFGELRVHSLSDLAPAPGSEEVVLRIARDRFTTAVDVRLPLTGLSVPTLSEAHAQVAWIVILMLWFTAFLGPFGSPSLWLARVQSRIRHGEPLLALGLWDDQPRVRCLHDVPRRRVPRHPARLLSDVAVPLIVTSLLLAVALLQPIFGLRFNSLQVYLGFAAFLLWLSLLQGQGTWPERMRSARKALGQLSVMMLIVGCACALSGTRSLEGIVATQGSFPQRWGVFAQPALFLLFPVFVIVESAPPEVRLGHGHGPWARGATYAALVLGRLLLCAIGAAVFLGGWASQEWRFVGTVQAQLIGAALFVAKTFALALLLHAARSIALGRRRSPLLLPTLISLASLLTFLWVFLGADHEVRLFCGFVLSTAAGLVIVTAGLRVLTSSAPMGSAPTHAAPFR